ncbi:Gfo/Idh/MocA family oxidoreductase [Bacillus thuringiensis]|uniref:Gfo/Idh/MocA family oxidoreductase n=1 Tax=Bacillus thuringiensis TaxID=1428 RepID=UPI003D085286
MHHQLAPNVLIIGYGKIGKIKAQIWRQCGANVSISDITKKQIESAQTDGFSIDEPPFHTTYNFVDICTPSGTHIDVLWHLILMRSKFERVVIEKPLISNIQEKNKLYQLLDNDDSLYEKIVVNEQYYKSKMIKLLREKIKNDSIISLEITMSKNRTVDNKHGRFFDHDIGSYGIEVPHMLAILEILDQSINDVKLMKNVLYVDSNNKSNQGVHIEYVSESGATVRINSFLGDFKISSSNKILHNLTIERHVFIKGKKFEYRLTLDPHPSQERLVTELNFGTKSILIHDDMLKEHISDIIKGNIAEGCKLKYAIKQSQQIMSLFNNTKIVKITKEDTYVHNS